jgi:hypothetical protein
VKRVFGTGLGGHLAGDRSNELRGRRSKGADTLSGSLMAQRRERPPVERGGQGLNVRLPDGRTMSVPGSALRDPVTPDVCCFCGVSVEHSDPQRVRLDARWTSDGTDQHQSWAAHHKCLLERMHEGVMGQGPFFGRD